MLVAYQVGMVGRNYQLQSGVCGKIQGYVWLPEVATSPYRLTTKQSTHYSLHYESATILRIKNLGYGHPMESQS